MKDKRKAVRQSPGREEGIDKTPPVTSKRPDKNPLKRPSPKIKAISFDTILKIMKFPHIKPIVETLSRIDEIKKPGSRAESGMGGLSFLLSLKELFSPLVKRPAITEEKMCRAYIKSPVLKEEKCPEPIVPSVNIMPALFENTGRRSASLFDILFSL